MQITLNKDEIALLFRQDPSARSDGGFQNFIVKLQSKLDQPSGILELSDDEIDRIARYAFDYGSGGWEKLLVGVFGRVLGEKLGR
jgi:hypothetical protein